jgi:hypothetical protein
VQQRAREIAVIRHADEARSRGKRRVQKESDRHIDVDAEQLVRERHEMIVMDPYSGVRSDQAAQRDREHAVDFAVGRVVVAVGADEIGA